MRIQAVLNSSIVRRRNANRVLVIVEVTNMRSIVLRNRTCSMIIHGQIRSEVHRNVLFHSWITILVIIRDWHASTVLSKFARSWSEDMGRTGSIIIWSKITRRALVISKISISVERRRWIEKIRIPSQRSNYRCITRVVRCTCYTNRRARIAYEILGTIVSIWNVRSLVILSDVRLLRWVVWRQSRMNVMTWRIQRRKKLTISRKVETITRYPRRISRSPITSEKRDARPIV